MKTKIQNKVMRKVFLIWFSRKILPYVVIDFLALGFFAYLIGEYVFVQVVFENLSRILFSSPAGLAGYVFGALWGTKLVVQVSLAAVLAAVVLAFKNVFWLFVQLGALKQETNFRQRAF